MRIIFQVFILALLSMFTSITFAADAFVAGKQYEIIANTAEAPASGKTVTEFFSYGCPACYQFEPTIEAWVAKKPKDVQFDRVPVIFSSAWEPYAKAYYTAVSLGIVKKIQPALFKAIHLQGQDLADDNAMAKFFAEHGVSAKAFADVYNNTPSMSARLHKGNMLLSTYGVVNVPTVVVNGRYRISRGAVRSDEEFIQVINFLLKK